MGASWALHPWRYRDGALCFQDSRTRLNIFMTLFLLVDANIWPPFKDIFCAKHRIPKIVYFYIASRKSHTSSREPQTTTVFPYTRALQRIFSFTVFWLKVNSSIFPADCQFWFNQELLRPDSNLHYPHDHAFSHRRTQSNYRTIQLLSRDDSRCQVGTLVKL